MNRRPRETKARIPRSRFPLPSNAETSPDPSARRRRWPIATALRKTLEGGYRKGELTADLFAGLVVGIVALPLSMALGIAVGATPQAGLYTAIVAGASVALLGGSKFQVTGPTAAFVVVLAPIVARHGLAGLLTAGLLAGLLLVAMGFLRMGRLIQFIPHPVTTGFTTGIGVVIATLQLKDALGLVTGPLPDPFVEKVVALARAAPSAKPEECAIAATTLTLLLLVPRVTRKVPAPLIALGATSLGVFALTHVSPTFRPATLGTRFSTLVDGVVVPGIPQVPPLPALPWGDVLSLALIRDLFPSAVAIALLGAIESLLSAVIADGLTGKKHDPDAELVGLGIGNVLAAMFGGVAATGALARTATNIRAGARSPFAAVFHALFVLSSVLLFAPLVAYVPMASLAALLLLVAFNMAELHAFAGVIQVAPKSDVAVLLVCFGLTVLFDMVLAIGVGVVLAALLFMRRMAELTEARVMLPAELDERQLELPQGVGLYEVQGPLFFGAAERAGHALHASHGDSYRVLVLHLGRVPVIDVTGLVALDNAIAALVRQGKQVVIAGPLPRPDRVFERSRLLERHVGLSFASTLPEALTAAARLLAEEETAP